VSGREGAAKRASTRSVEQLNQLIEDQQSFQALITVFDRINEDTDDDIRAWLRWAKQEVQSIDPLMRLKLSTELSQRTERQAHENGADLWPNPETE
jgi:hypothetical protein